MYQSAPRRNCKAFKLSTLMRPTWVKVAQADLFPVVDKVSVWFMMRYNSSLTFVLTFLYLPGFC